MASARRAGSKPDEHVVAMRQIEVAIARMVHPRLRGERTAADAAMRAKPGLRIVAIAIGGKSRVRDERVRRPFPYRSAPGNRAKGSGALPFGLARKAPARKAAEGLGLVGVDMAHRRVGRKRLVMPEPSLLPAAHPLAPAPWMVDARFAEPREPLIGPKARLAIAARVDELFVGRVANAISRYPIRFERDVMRPLLVVEHEAFATRRPLCEDAALDLDIALAGRQKRQAKQPRRLVVERLAHVRERLAMHVLVEQRELERIQVALVGDRELRVHGFVYRPRVIANLVKRRNVERPAVDVCNKRRKIGRAHV